MKTFIKFYFLTLLILVSSTNLIAQDQILKLPNGKKVILHSDKTWNYYENIKYDFDFKKLRDNEIPSFLRQSIRVKKSTLKTAIKMYLQGWRYTMPAPKSTQASWGNSDGRTTWYMGYWHNKKTGKYSNTTPLIKTNGYYLGDNQNQQNYWRRGGSPHYPTKIEWLLSNYGGVKP